MNIVDINFLVQEDYDRVVAFLHSKYPPDKYKICYYHNPFYMGYNIAFGLSLRSDDVAKKLIQSIGDAVIYRLLHEQFPEFVFDETLSTRKVKMDQWEYNQYDHLLNFLVSNDYELPKDRISRFLVSKDGVKAYLTYNTDGTALKKNKQTDEKNN